MARWFLANLIVDSGRASREAWLNTMVDKLRPVFMDRGYRLPEKIRVSCGFPSRNAFGKMPTIGQCHYPASSADGTTEVFISPVIADTLRVGDVLVHELSHAHLGPGHGHKGAFGRVAGAIGLVKPWKATTASPELIELLKKLSPGDYPHAQLSGIAEHDKPEKTYLLKAACECGYVIRVTRKWADTGLPTCVCGQEFQLEEAE